MTEFDYSLLVAEWCSKREMRAGTFLEVSQINKIVEVRSSAGYRSVYMFEKEDVKGMTNSVGLARYTLYSDTLFIDIDTLDTEVLQKAFDALDDIEAGYKCYFSGSKGYHFHVDIEPMVGTEVAISQKHYVQSILGIIEADPSIYQAHMIIRLPNCVHEKTKVKKKLIKETYGDKLHIPMLPKPTMSFQKYESRELNTPEELTLTFLFMANIVEQPQLGTRYMTLWQQGRRLLESGLSLEVVKELLTMVNNKWKNPKEPRELNLLFKDLSRLRHRKCFSQSTKQVEVSAGQ